jgi:hypothetical protein
VEGRLYVVGEMKFESLVDLVNFYFKFPLYKTVKLTIPISKEIVKRMGNLSVSFSFGVSYGFSDFNGFFIYYPSYLTTAMPTLVLVIWTPPASKKGSQ